MHLCEHSACRVFFVSQQYCDCSLVNSQNLVSVADCHSKTISPARLSEANATVMLLSTVSSHVTKTCACLVILGQRELTNGNTHCNTIKVSKRL